ncbi:MAG: NAD-glutamate dehydrogenase [Alphaproteobacteria bacterium]|nr:NAD-glutamate dehydrogenase [Alphaproteobacteria bacterium]
MLDQRIVDCYANYVHQVFLQEAPGREVRADYSDPRARLYDAWKENPQIAQRIMAMFHHKFSPTSSSTSNGDIGDDGGNLDDLKQGDFGPMICAIEQTVRTNFYCPDAQAMVIKILHPNGIIEIFMDHPVFQGVMLKGAMMARGGLRWSDREDFRTECWQLMQTQVLKNTIIVPSGSKGAFLIKDDRISALQAYEMFVHGILDISDNLAGRNVISPTNVRCYDGHDFYNVVAADKGTASFSDHGNAIALRRGYWLGDAFASGGSNGYNHKKLAITSRGSWVSIRHHLAKLGYGGEHPLTMVGVGDMAGDVFGNGMLEDSNVQLLAAFNYESIFIDPNPDPDASYRERCRLFHLPGSRWSDYADFSLGGAVYSRHQAQIELSDQACKMLGLTSCFIGPNDLIKAILSMQADVLFLGGIGTFVQAQSEQNVMDAANAETRVYGKDLRVKIVAEGANLGMTQAGRIEYALAGGILNTDAVDNCAGVNCSDHEINIKILLDQVVQNGAIDQSERALILQAITEDVCTHVLRENAWQNLALTFSALGDQSAILDRTVGFLQAYKAICGVADDGLDALLEGLQGRKQGAGVTRPEMAVVLAYVKRYLRGVLEKMDLSELGEEYVVRYFPRAVQERFSSFLKHHFLFSEIKITMLVNRFVDMLGPIGLFSIVQDLDISVMDAVRALLVLDHQINGHRMGQKILGKMGDLDAAVALMELYRDVVRGGLVHWAKQWKSDPKYGISVKDTAKDVRLWDRYQAELSVVTDVPIRL